MSSIYTVKSENIAVFPLSTARPQAIKNSRAITEDKLATITRIATDKESFVVSCSENELLFVLNGYVVSVSQWSTVADDIISKLSWQSSSFLYASLSTTENDEMYSCEDTKPDGRNEYTFSGIQFTTYDPNNSSDTLTLHKLQLFSGYTTDSPKTFIVPRSSLRCIDGGTI